MKKKKILIIGVLLITTVIVGCNKNNNRSDNKFSDINLHNGIRCLEEEIEVNEDFFNTEVIDLEVDNEVEKATKAYNEFLENKISVDEIDMNFITIPTREPDRHYATRYALFDSNGDKIPELHIHSARYYYVLTYKNDELSIFLALSPEHYALKNGAFICRSFAGGPLSDAYGYYIFDYLGNEVWTVTFSKYDKNQNGVYDKNDEYMFDGVKVSKKIWEALTEQYIYVDEDGFEQIRDEIEWTVIYEETT